VRLYDFSQVLADTNSALADARQNQAVQHLSISFRRIALAAGAVVVLGGAAVGIAAAQPQPSTTPTAQSNNYQKFVDALAQKLGVSSQTLQTDIDQARQAAGLPAGGGFPGRGAPGQGGPRGGFGGFNLQTAATAIGITPQQLRTELQGTNNNRQSLAQVAQAHGKSANDVATALKNEAHTRIDLAVANGRLTADQGNTAKTSTDQRIDQLVNQVAPQRGPAGGPGGFGFGPGVVRQGFDTAAKAIGITPQQLRTELQGTNNQSKSLAQVAQAHGKTANDVATALKNEAHTRIDQAVTADKLTADQANTMKAKIDQSIDQLVNQVMPQRGAGQGGFGRRGPGAPAGQDQTGG